MEPQTPAVKDHTSSFKDENRKERKKLNQGWVGDELVSVYYFAKMQQQVTFTDDNKLSFYHQLIKANSEFTH